MSWNGFGVSVPIPICDGQEEKLVPFGRSEPFAEPVGTAWNGETRYGTERAPVLLALKVRAGVHPIVRAGIREPFGILKRFTLRSPKRWDW